MDKMQRLILVLIVMLGIVLITLMIVGVVNASLGPEMIGQEEYVIYPGDTLWDIYDSECPETISWRIFEIDTASLNTGSIVDLYPGQVIILPLY